MGWGTYKTRGLVEMLVEMIEEKRNAIARIQSELELLEQAYFLLEGHKYNKVEGQKQGQWGR